MTGRQRRTKSRVSTHEMIDRERHNMSEARDTSVSATNDCSLVRDAGDADEVEIHSELVLDIVDICGLIL